MLHLYTCRLHIFRTINFIVNWDSSFLPIPLGSEVFTFILFYHHLFNLSPSDIEWYLHTLSSLNMLFQFHCQNSCVWLNLPSTPPRAARFSVISYTICFDLKPFLGKIKSNEIITTGRKISALIKSPSSQK